MVWVPYDCYYHLYSGQDIMHCLEEKDWHWEVVMGDSVVREVATNTMAQFRRLDGFKFEHVDYQLADLFPVKWEFRIVYEFFLPLFYLGHGAPRSFEADKVFLDQYNFLGLTSKGGEIGRDKDRPKEETRPDIIVMNGGAVFSVYKTNFTDWQGWVAKFIDYLKPWVEDKTTNKPVLVWYSGPYILSPPHDYKWELTGPRMIQFCRYAEEKLRPLGIRIVDALVPTSTRPDQTWDGTHYSRSSNGKWLGPTSNMMTQIVHNVVFQDCTGTGVRYTEPATE
eukprot:TRINITY_DN7703_c0_g1_i1.p1 TRINITY_DN7703_c0_g1~~TRINITY_DN7703_c0_g1_i1.p1  ORF type:complete len:280 (+),score=25.25 TRINITY_DN7703_c0_g1_i1:2-841(+)